MFSPSTSKRLAAAVAAAALMGAVPAQGAPADAGHQDLRSPDAVDAAREAGDPPRVAPAPSSIAASEVEQYQDLRTPDTRDAAVGYSPALEAQTAVDEPSLSSGFDWLSAAIGAAAGAGVLVIVLAATGGFTRLRPMRGHGAARA